MNRQSLILLTVLTLMLGVCQSVMGWAWAYQRPLIEAGHYYLLLTGHFVHLNTIHLGLNTLGLILVLLLFDRVYRWYEWLAWLFSSAIAVSLMMYYCLPTVTYYVGLSAVLHSLYVAGAMRLLLTPERQFAGVLLVLVSIKLFVENMGMGDSLTARLIDGHVLTESHLFGAIFAFFASIGVLIFKTLSANHGKIT
ncbi:rhombosortase [Agitococcus lubricus]|uniref:Rhomboid family GlyGly-CTERM serine protease n=1 Tax=Agitococcus lubricus TaxID=1077255 RepID=A0A2T5J337_9GAMM|nr:rhombosortase [Agitococcus lubricus]PTQ90992.1 rhomboid family GlyGly-CTERM serine protease [Agitococcus lubricus]